MNRMRFVLAAAGWLALAATISACGRTEQATRTPASPPQAAAPTVTAAPSQRGQALADSLLAQWKVKNPDEAADWVADEKARHAIKPPADNSGLLQAGGQEQGHVYGAYTERDLVTWTRETEKLVVEGSRVFHSGDALGSTVAVSCDMCHPDAANTHPETYPKFQTQMGRTALLRDMINWCLVNPVRAERMAPDDPRMRAIEAYIYAQRTGTPLSYGKH